MRIYGKENEIIVKETVVRTIKKGEADFICITDIAKFKNLEDPNGVIANWMRNRNTVILIPSNSRGLKGKQG